MTDYARTILGVMAAGYDPTNFQGIDLVSIIKNSVLEDGKFKDTIKGGEDLINCHVWSMIALEASGTAYDREKALKYLEGKQNKDGGFYIFAPYPDSDVDFTAMSVLALTMAGRDSKSPSVSNALSYLKGKLIAMEKDQKLETVETLSVILEAITSAGDNVNNYKINGRNIAEELFTFRDTTGGFKHLKTGSVNDIATRQVVTALGFYKNNKTMYSELNYKKGNFFTGKYQGVAFVKIHNASYDVKGGTVEFEALAENVDEVDIEIPITRIPIKKY
jgi:prenyltransferase beta subunit